MIRVVCEFCQTVYNIPEAKLSRPVSQATCKVCKNRIVIRRDGADAQDSTEGRIVAPPPVGPEDGNIAETELSNSWRAAIVDNRETIQLLKKVGVPGPPESSTATGPKANVIPGVPAGAIPATMVSQLPRDENTDAGMEERTSQGAPAPLAHGDGPSLVGIERSIPLPASDGPSRLELARPPTRPSRAAVSAPPAALQRSDRGVSASATAVAGLAALAAAMLLALSGEWAGGLSGLMAFGATAFAGGAALSTALIRRRGIFGALLPLAAGALLAAVATVALIGTHREQVRSLMASHGWEKPAGE